MEDDVTRGASHRARSAKPWFPWVAGVATVLACMRCSRSSHQADSSQPLTPVRSAPAIRFPYASESAGLSVFADVEQPVDQLRVFAERSLHDSRGWLGAETLQSPRYTIFLCQDLETIRRLEQQHGLPRSDPAPYRTFEFRGGFYSGVNMVALRCGPGEDARWNIAHELSHAAFDEVVGKSCDAINEGLAEYNAAKVLGWPQSQYLFDAAREAYKGSLIPSLARLFALNYWEFRDDRVKWRYVALSWVLARLLLEDESPAIEGRFPELLATMRFRDPWDALQVTYDLPTLEQAWRNKVESLTRWTQVFGEWSQDGDSLEVTTRGAAILVHRDRPALSEQFDIRVRHSDMDGRTDFGFVLGFQDVDHYIVSCLRVSEARIVICTRDGDRWKSTQFVSMKDLPEDWESEDVQLHCNAEGELRFSYGSRCLAEYDLGLVAFEGGIGLFGEARSHSKDDQVRLAYRYADVRLNPR